jgi:diacylglycerol kinase (ATP)
MPTLKTCFVVNPRSGHAARAQAALTTFARRHGADVRCTERPHHATELARQALESGCALIVAVGGDGTLNEVARTLVGTDAILGLVPCGSGNGLGRHLGVHGSPAHALELLVTGLPIRIDTGLVGGHPFFTAAGIGFEAEIARRFNQLRRRGFARYLTTSARALHECPPQEYRLISDGRTESVRAFTLTVANANQYGNNARIAPSARLDDGRLDLCVVPPLTFTNALPLALRLFRGTLADPRDILHRSGTEFVVERDRPGPLHTDGELHDLGTRLEFSVRPASLRVMAPAQPAP